MNLKPCLFAGIFVFALAGDSVAHRLQAQNLFEGGSPIVVAQNDQQGFFGRIFNRSKDKADTSPIFLNKQGTNGRQSSTTISPYKFQGQGLSSSLALDKAMAEIMASDRARNEALSERVNKQTEFALLAGEREVARLRQLRERDKQVRQTGGQQGARKMVYDPARVWTYNRNRAPQGQLEEPESSGPSRIYNTR